MRWIDGSEIDPKQFTGAALCEKLAVDLHGGYDEYLNCADFIKEYISPQFRQLKINQNYNLKL